MLKYFSKRKQRSKIRKDAMLIDPDVDVSAKHFEYYYIQEYLARGRPNHWYPRSISGETESMENAFEWMVQRKENSSNTDAENLHTVEQYVYHHIMNEVYNAAESYQERYALKRFGYNYMRDSIYSDYIEKRSLKGTRRLRSTTPDLMIEINRGTYKYPNEESVYGVLSTPSHMFKIFDRDVHDFQIETGFSTIGVWLSHHHRLHDAFKLLKDHYDESCVFDMRTAFDKYRISAALTSLEYRIAGQAFLNFLLKTFQKSVEGAKLDDMLPWEWQEQVLLEEFLKNLENKELFEEVYHKALYASLRMFFSKIHDITNETVVLLYPYHFNKILRDGVQCKTMREQYRI